MANKNTNIEVLSESTKKMNEMYDVVIESKEELIQDFQFNCNMTKEEAMRATDNVFLQDQEARVIDKNQVEKLFDEENLIIFG